MRPSLAVWLFASAALSACGDASDPIAAAGGSGGASAGGTGGAGGKGGSVDPPSCDRPLPAVTSNGLGPTCRVDEDCTGDGVVCQTGPRSFGLLCVADAECTRSGFFACERGGLCASECQADSACPAFERCTGGRCRSRPCEDGICPAGATCGPTFTCAPVACEAGPSGCGEQDLCVTGDANFNCVPRPCSEDAACAPAGLCILGGCRAKICGCDADCGTEALCLGGRCTRDPGVCVSATETSFER